MASLDVKFSGEIFRKDFPMVIATNRQNAVLLPVRLQYVVGGYVAGQVLARDPADGLYKKYDDAGAPGVATAAAVLFESIAESDFDGVLASSSTTAVGIFGGCTLYLDKLVGYDAAAGVDLGAKEIIDASGVSLLKV